MAAFQKLVTDIVAIAGQQERGGHPVPPRAPNSAFRRAGMDGEARALAPKGKRLLLAVDRHSAETLCWPWTG